MTQKLVLKLADAQATASRVAAAVTELRGALAESGLSPAEAGEIEFELHGTLYPQEGQHVIPDSDLALLCDAFGLARKPGETAHQVIHKVAGMRKRST